MRGFARPLIAAVALLALPAVAFAEEYAVSSFAGGFEAPPSPPTQAIAPGVDDATVSVVLPFEFPYFGRLFDRVSICSNGWVALGSTTATVSANPALPTAAAPDGVVAALWDDLKTGTGNVVHFTVGDPGARRFVVSWQNVDTFSAANANDMSFQVKLHELSGIVEIAYAGGGTWRGLSFTAGIEDPSGTIAYGGPNTLSTNSGQPGVDQRFTPNGVLLDGSLRRDRPVADATGLGNSVETDLPLGGVDLEIVREDTGEVAARTRAGDDGLFSVAVLGVDDPSTLAVDVLASGAAARVTGSDGSVYSYRIATGVSAGSATSLGAFTFDAAVDALDADIGPALNVHQAAHRARAFATREADAWAAAENPPVAPETFSQLEFRWVAGLASGTSYTPAVGVSTPAIARVGDGPANRDPYDDDLLLREYGQHVLATISSHTVEVSPRGWAVESTPELAWADGFAHWFAAVVQGRAELYDTTGPSAAIVFDLETPDPAATGARAGAVAASLWELVDGANEPEDEFAGTAGPAPSTAGDVFATIDRDLDVLPPGTPGFTARAFFDVWLDDAPDTTGRVQTARAFIHHGTLVDDSLEPNDREAEASVLLPGLQKIEGLRLSPFNEDHVLIEVPGPGSSELVVALQQETDTDLEIEILDGGGGTVATATNVAQTTGRDVVTAMSPAPVPAGTYRVRVAWAGGESARYTLSFFGPLVIATNALPDWTVDVPFKEDIVVAGGIPPYAYTLTEDSPELVSQEGGSRLAGTPLTAGDFAVQVTVSDTAAPANQVQVDLPLRINGPLALPGLWGVPEATSLDVDLGTGGTATTWTPVLLPPAGLTLSGSGTLTLSGNSGAPRSFLVSASAVDAVGASLAETNATIVVTRALAGKAVEPITPSSYFGFHFDALAGSTAKLVFRFPGPGARPDFDRIVDQAGQPVTISRAQRKTSAWILRGVEMPATGRYFAVFRDNGTKTQVKVVPKVRPPTKGRGQVAISTPDEIVDVLFEAVAGSVMSIRLEASPSPLPIEPSLRGVTAPQSGDLDVTRARRRRGGKIVKLKRLRLPDTGTYVLRLEGDASSVGPLFYRYRIDPPRRIPLALD